jgi:hypothetical protein
MSNGTVVYELLKKNNYNDKYECVAFHVTGQLIISYQLHRVAAGNLQSNSVQPVKPSVILLNCVQKTILL